MRPSNRVFLLSALLCVGVMQPASVLAHGASPGMVGFGKGLIHPLITPPHLLLLLALGLLAGQHRLSLKAPMLVFATLSGVALLMTTRLVVPAPAQLLVLCAALGTALLVAMSARPAPWGLLMLYGLSALGLGLDSGVDLGAAAAATATTLSATWIGLNLCMVNLAYYISLCPPRKWVQTGLRVAGSWIAAICVMVMAFALRGGVQG